MIHHFYAMAGVIPYGNTAMKAVGAAIKAALAQPVKLSDLARFPSRRADDLHIRS
jgi:hypothetical protein